MRKQPNTIHHQAITVWMDYYKTTTGEDYIFNGGKDGKSLQSLLKKVRDKLIQKSIEQTDDNILNSLRGLLESVKDPWILDNLDISIVSSKFNQIYAKAIKQNPFSRASNIREMVRKEYGPDSKRTA